MFINEMSIYPKSMNKKLRYVFVILGVILVLYLGTDPFSHLSRLMYLLQPR